MTDTDTDTDTDIEQTEFTFAELTGRAQEKARQTLYEWATDHEWWEGDYDNAKEEGLKRGFEIEDIRFSGFWSQGDGASWTGSVRLVPFLEWMLSQPEGTPQFRRIDADRHRYIVLVELINEQWIESPVSVTRRGFHYVHENTVTATGVAWDTLDIVEEGDDHVLHADGILKGANVAVLAQGIEIRSLIDDLDKMIEEEVRDYCQEIYKGLEKTYDDITSDESLAENAEANDYKFDEDGDVI